MEIAPIVTVILPVYNGNLHLEKAVISIQKQSYKNWELLIINDGSDDETLNICKDIVKKDSRIKLINNKKHLGLVKSLNIGLELAKGKYIARQDADDLSLPARLEKQIKFLDSHKEYGLVCSTFMVTTEEGKIIKITALPTDDYEIKLSLLFFNPITHGAVMFKKNILEKFNLKYEESDLYCEDYGLWVRLSDKTKFKILKEPLYKWTVSKNGITASHLSEMKSNIEKISKKITTIINIKKLKELSKYYQNKKYEYDGSSYTINNCLMYQKLLLNLSKLAFNKNQPMLAAELLLQSFIMNPLSYFKKILFIQKNQKLDKLPLNELILKI